MGSVSCLYVPTGLHLGFEKRTDKLGGMPSCELRLISTALHSFGGPPATTASALSVGSKQQHVGRASLVVVASRGLAQAFTTGAKPGFAQFERRSSLGGGLTASLTPRNTLVAMSIFH